MSDTTPSEDDRYPNDRPDPATARRRAALSVLLAAARQDPDADWPTVCRRARYAATRVGLSLTQPDFDDLYARPLCDLLDPAAAKAAGPPAPAGIVTAAHIHVLAGADPGAVLTRRRGRFQVTTAGLAAALAEQWPDHQLEIVTDQDALRAWVETVYPVGPALRDLRWEACAEYAATLNEALEQEQARTHTGLAAHDGYAEHSHEVRADHRGVAKAGPPVPAGPTADEYAGLAVSYATAALEYLQTLDGWPGFSRWLAANPDTADGELTRKEQLRGAEVILTALSLRYFGVTPDEVAAELGGAAKAGRITAQAVRDMGAPLRSVVISPNTAIAASAAILRGHEHGGPGHDDGDACGELARRLRDGGSS